MRTTASSRARRRLAASLPTLRTVFLSGSLGLLATMAFGGAISGATPDPSGAQPLDSASST